VGETEHSSHSLRSNLISSAIDFNVLEFKERKVTEETWVDLRFPERNDMVELRATVRQVPQGLHSIYSFV